MTPTKPKFLKRIKPKQRQEVREVNQKTMNLLFLGGLVAIVGLATLSIIVSLTRSNVPKTVIQEVKKDDSSIDYKLHYYLNDYVKNYFTLSDDNAVQSEQIAYLNSFYDVPPEIRNQGHVRSTTELISAKLLTINEQVATYQVTYATGVGESRKEMTTGFAVPFGEKDDTYFISGLPWHVKLPSIQAKKGSSNDSLKLVEDTETDKQTKDSLDSFLKLFFTNYTSNQENLDLIANNLLALEGTIFKNLDYSYYRNNGKTITAYAQVTFEVAGNTHSENFNLIIEEKDKSYYVQKLSHTITKDYLKPQTKEKGDTK
ncbi:conjugal transfer protein [Streptococcus entericus]|uniref:conjugal transfer protein n=1 Tax=Streptococcus entericus TaxID=155680 RepID=UPI000368AABE|nr:conjugal transfer protein [Streptococcus entericus]